MNVCVETAGTPGLPELLANEFWMTACGSVSPFSEAQIVFFCHSGLDPESSAVRHLHLLDAGSSPA